MSRDGRVKRLASEAQFGGFAENGKRRTATAFEARAALVPQPALVPVGTADGGAVTDDSLSSEMRNCESCVSDFAHDWGILTGMKLVASKLAELDRRSGDAASRILAELILSDDRERCARTERPVVSSGDCVFVQYLDCDMQDETAWLWRGGMHCYRTLAWASADQARGVGDEAVAVEIVIHPSVARRSREFRIIRGQQINILQNLERTTGECLGSCTSGKVDLDGSCGPLLKTRCGSQLSTARTPTCDWGASDLYQVGRIFASSARTTSCTTSTEGRRPLAIPTRQADSLGWAFRLARRRLHRGPGFAVLFCFTSVLAEQTKIRSLNSGRESRWCYLRRQALRLPSPMRWLGSWYNGALATVRKRTLAFLCVQVTRVT